LGVGFHWESFLKLLIATYVVVFSVPNLRLVKKEDVTACHLTHLMSPEDLYYCQIDYSHCNLWAVAVLVGDKVIEG
jgi:hypothetical protein